MKWLLLAVGFLLTSVVFVFVTGLLLPKGHLVTRKALYHQPMEAVFETITDFAAFPDWRQGIEKVELVTDVEGDGAVRFRETGQFGPVLYEVVESRPPERLVVRIADENLPYGGSWTYELTDVPDDHATSLSITEAGEVKSPLFRFFSTVVFSKHATIDRYLLSLGTKFGEGVTPETVSP